LLVISISILQIRLIILAISAEKKLMMMNNFHSFGADFIEPNLVYEDV
jgi:hypothetical protein